MRVITPIRFEIFGQYLVDLWTKSRRHVLCKNDDLFLHFLNFFALEILPHSYSALHNYNILSDILMILGSIVHEFAKVSGTRTTTPGATVFYPPATPPPPPTHTHTHTHTPPAPFKEWWKGHIVLPLSVLRR